MGDVIPDDPMASHGGVAAFAAITDASSRGRSTGMVNTRLPFMSGCANAGCVPIDHLLDVTESAFQLSTNPFSAVQYSDGVPTIGRTITRNESNRLIRNFRQQNTVKVADHNY